MTTGYDSISSSSTAETRLADLLDSTLWNRRLAPSSERVVYALVYQIFHGIKEHFLVSTELKVCAYLLCLWRVFLHLAFLIRHLVLVSWILYVTFTHSRSRSITCWNFISISSLMAISPPFLQFNCFFLMPVVDKLPALLREDLESAFGDDLDHIFDITQLRHSLGQRRCESEIELKRVLTWNLPCELLVFLVYVLTQMYWL